MLPNGIMNIAAWGGPTARVMATLHLDSNQVFLPLIPAIAATFVGTVGIAWYLGLKERKGLGNIDFVYTGPKVSERGLIDEDQIHPPREQRNVPAWRQAFNIVLTVGLMVLLVLAIAPLAALFMFAFAITITVNFPKLSEQRERLATHSGSVMAVVSVIFVAGVFTGILKGTEMTEAPAQSICLADSRRAWKPASLRGGTHQRPVHVFPLERPFYFGVVPVLAEAGKAYGIAPVVIARASLTGRRFTNSARWSCWVCAHWSGGVELGDHQRFSIKCATLLAFFMLLAALVTGAVTIF